MPGRRPETKMEREESPLLHEPDLMLAALRVAAGSTGTVDACIEQLRLLRQCAKVRERVAQSEVRAGLETAIAKLERARLVERAGGCGWRITPRGREMLAAHPRGIDDSVLMRFPEFRPAVDEGAEVHEAAPPRRSHYDQGYEAFGTGRGLADNPHAPDVRASLDWENGWSQARDDASRRRPRLWRSASAR
jgi:restriction system protein